MSMGEAIVGGASFAVFYVLTSLLLDWMKARHRVAKEIARIRAEGIRRGQ